MYKFIQLFEMDRLLTILFSYHYDTVNLYVSKHVHKSHRKWNSMLTV